jgi:signal transduction histidine kinase
VVDRIERLGGLVDDLFELSRIQADAVRLNLEPVVLAELVSDTIASARITAEHKGVQLTGAAFDQNAMAELSIPEIAATLGVSTNSVKTHLQRGLRSMAQTLEAKQ